MIRASFAGRTRSRPAQRYLPLVEAVIARVRAQAFEALVVAFAVAAVVEASLASHVQHRVVVALVSLGWTLPFAFRRRHPFWAPLTAAAALGLVAAVDPTATQRLTMPFIAAIAAAVAFGYQRERGLAIAGWAAIAGAAAFLDYRTTSTLADFFWTTLILSLAWVFGVALGTRTEQARELRERVRTVERERAQAEERAAGEERARIARELHDVVAHSVSVMVVQASGVRRLLQEEQHREREALMSVEQIGRQALMEMRRMLGVMRTGEEQPAALAPQPGLQHLDRLIAQVEEAGLPVTLHVEGERPELPPGVDLSAYRIVQEGLTNALKHAKGASAQVTVRYDDASVQLEVADDGPGVDGANGAGHGLVGMRERVALYGGTLEAGPRDGGGFVLRAKLPVEARG